MHIERFIESVKLSFRKEISFLSNLLNYIGFLNVDLNKNVLDF